MKWPSLPTYANARAKGLKNPEHLQVQDKDLLTRDDMVGMTTITTDMLTAMCESGVSTTESMELVKPHPSLGPQPVVGYSGKIATVQFKWSAKPGDSKK